MRHPVLFMIQHLDKGGSEIHLGELLENLDRERFEPHLIYFRGGLVSRKLEELDWIRMTQMPVTRAYDLSGLRAIARVRRYLREHRIRAVVTYHFAADFIGTLAAWGRRRPPVVSSRRDMGFTRTWRQKWIGRRLDRGVARYVAVSDAVRHAIARDEHVDLDKIEVVYNGIDPETLNVSEGDSAAEREALGLAPEDRVIACVAGLNPIKCHLTLVDAFERLRAQHPGEPFKLLIAGEGRMRPTIEEYVRERNLGEHVLMPGHRPAPAADFLLGEVAVLPSESEGFSNTIVQAMAMSRPVVACRVGGNPEAVVEGETGFLVEPRNAEALAEAMGRLLSDSDLARRMGDAGRRRALEQFTRRHMIERTEQLLIDLMDKQTVG